LREGITGNALSKDIETFRAAGADEIITKPITKAKLVESLLFYVNNSP
jgi:CheY-like chemotaxis protein